MITCPYKKCGFSFDLEGKKLVYEKYGYSCFCPKCGRPILLTRQANLKHGKIHMSKKERLKLRKEEHGKAEKPLGA
ncbi:MAG: hypothetical protein SAMD01599839_08330 [Rectinema sp.]